MRGMGGRGNLMLKPDERKKLLEDKRGNLDIETKLRCTRKIVRNPEAKS